MTAEQENAKLRELLLEMHKLVWSEAISNSGYMTAWKRLDREMAELGFFPNRRKT